MHPTAIILAAGKSTRMKSRRPKVLHEVSGKPMLEYVLDACFGAGCERVLVVVGHGKEAVRACFAERHERGQIAWVEQTEQLGTGHAAKMCIGELQRHPAGDVFILAGDGPLITAGVLQSLRKAHHDDGADASMATALLDDPTGYGRVIRDEQGRFVEIVEQIDCTPEQRGIREVFPSIYCVKSEALIDALGKLRNENRKGEYYLTDIYGILRQAGRRVLATQAVTEEDVLAVNSRDQLALVDSVMQRRVHRRHFDAGVSIVGGSSAYIEAGATIGADTVIQPFSFVGRDATIGVGCEIGPFAAVARRGVVADGAVVAGNVAPGAAPRVE